MAKETTAKKIDDVIGARRQEIETTLAEIAEAIEKYSLLAQFSFINGGEGSPGEYLFHKMDKEAPPTQDWYERWLCKLFPEADEATRQSKTDGGLTDPAINLIFASQKFGFLLGVLVGMNNMGASKEELVRRSEGFVFPEIECARYHTESESRQAAKK